MANAFTLTNYVAKLAAAHLQASTPVYRLTARADLAVALTGVEAYGQSVDILLPDAGSSSLLAEGGTTTATDITEGRVTLSMNKHWYSLKSHNAVDAMFRAHRTLEGAVEQALGGSLLKIGEDVEAAILDVAKVCPYFVGSPGTALDTKAKVTAGIPVLQKNRGQLGRLTGIFNPDDYNSISNIDAFSNTNTRGNDFTMQTGEIGVVWGVNWVVSRAANQPTDNYSLAHVAGTMEGVTPLVDGAVSAGATTMNIDDVGGGTETLVVGDLFTITGVDGQYCVVPNTASPEYVAATETYTAVGGAITSVAFTPEAPTGGFGDDAVINLLASHNKNYLISPGALASVVLPPTNTALLSGVSANMQTIFDPRSGLGLALTLYERSSSTLGNDLSIDTFQGAVLVRPEAMVVYVT